MPPYGPKTCIKEPKRSMAIKKLRDIVLVMRIANFWKVIKVPPKRKAPEPKVVIVPLRILTPIS